MGKKFNKKLLEIIGSEQKERGKMFSDNLNEKTPAKQLFSILLIFIVLKHRKLTHLPRSDDSTC
jgi:hypothetical protein